MSRGGPVIGLGCMRLSTDPRRDDARAIDVLHAAFEAGVTLLDTADAYCWNDTETGHNERLIARALATWHGERSRIRVATKGGLTRPHGAWVANGRARHLASACEASLRALEVTRIDLFQLHVVDPRTPLATSVRALDGLKRDGLVESIGLCNVTVGQIEEARRLTEIASVQVELSVWHDEHLSSGVVEYCEAHGIELLAYRPLGGPERVKRTGSDAALADVASRHGATPFEIALAWLTDLSDRVRPLPGATSVEHAISSARASAIALTDADRATLDERFPSGRAFRQRDVSAARRPAADANGEVVLIMGLPGAGKSTLAATFVAQGYARLNRDEAGGTLAGLLPALDRLIASGVSRIVVDNTYVSRTTRAQVLQTAWAKGLPVRCIWLSTSVEDAQINAVSRIVSRHGRLLTPEEMRKTVKRDVSAFGPGVQFRYRRDLEPPDPAEGFSHIEVVPFVRRHDPSLVNRALIVWCDGILLRSRSGRRSPASADDVEVMAEHGEVLRRYQADGWRLLGMSWQPDVAEGSLTAADVDAIFAAMTERLGVAVEVAYCPHAAGPPICWCRKPLPGLAVVFIERHRLDPARCLYVGTGAQDPGFARRLGFLYRDAADVFAAPGR